MTRSAPEFRQVSRRRFIAITAAAGGAIVLPAVRAQNNKEAISWTGIALGANASLTIHHQDASEARKAIDACLSEVARLECVFSLHMAQSALSRLNRDGRISEAPADLRILLSQARDLARRTDGAFDPTIQPLWALYERHFSEGGAAPTGPDKSEVARARDLIGWRNVQIDGSHIMLQKRGMALTLNGIAQGYITDKVGECLRNRGFRHVLVNMGEQLALGPKWDGDAWHVGISDPTNREQVVETFPLRSGAVATSGGYGCAFDAEGRFTHILDPQAGGVARNWASVTVVADTATLADGLSTSLAASSPSRASALIAGRARAYVVPESGSSGRWL